MFYKKSVLKNIVLNFFKLHAATLLKKETLTQVFFCEFCKIFNNTFFTEHLRTSVSAQC